MVGHRDTHAVGCVLATPSGQFGGPEKAVQEPRQTRTLTLCIARGNGQVRGNRFGACAAALGGEVPCAAGCRQSRLWCFRGVCLFWPPCPVPRIAGQQLCAPGFCSHLSDPRSNRVRQVAGGPPPGSLRRPCRSWCSLGLCGSALGSSPACLPVALGLCRVGAACREAEAGSHAALLGW